MTTTNPAAVDVLLVEDNPNDAELTLMAMDAPGPAPCVEWVKDGAQALEFLFRTGRYAERPQRAPRLVLLDLNLPMVDGIDVVRRIRAEESMASIPIVILTSSASDGDLDESYRLGVNSYIVKPVDADAFMRYVRDVALYWLVLNTPRPER